MEGLKDNRFAVRRTFQGTSAVTLVEVRKAIEILDIEQTVRIHHQTKIVDGAGGQKNMKVRDRVSLTVRKTM
jgi:hypothetical protein